MTDVVFHEGIYSSVAGTADDLQEEGGEVGRGGRGGVCEITLYLYRRRG